MMVKYFALCSLLTCTHAAAIPPTKASRGRSLQPRDGSRPPEQVDLEQILERGLVEDANLNTTPRHDNTDTAGTVIVQRSSSRVEPLTSGADLNLDLNTLGQPTRGPLMTVPIPVPSSPPQLPLSNPTTSTDSEDSESIPAPKPNSKFKMASQDIFAERIDTKAPPKEMKTRDDHPVPRKGIASKGPLQTNKFYSNFFLGDQLAPTYTFPYTMAWSGGKGASSSWGLAVSHADAKERVFGQKKYNNSCSYFVNPLGIQSLVLSAKELGDRKSVV